VAAGDESCDVAGAAASTAGCTISIFDPDVEKAFLVGTNLEFIRTTLPHFEAMLRPTAADAVEGAHVVAVTYKSPVFASALRSLGSGVRVIDVANAVDGVPPDVEYEGIAW
jgi:hypothetical protein